MLITKLDFEFNLMFEDYVKLLVKIEFRELTDCQGYFNFGEVLKLYFEKKKEKKKKIYF
jgi:hypothetical protein